MAVNRKQVPVHLYDRYGIRPVRTKLIISIASTLALLALTGLWQIGSSLSAGGEAKLIGWESTSENSVSVIWSVHRYDDQPVWCVLRVLDEDRFDVGYAYVKVQATAFNPTFKVEIKTRGQIFAVDEPSCSEKDTSHIPAPHFRPGLLPPAQTDSLAAPWQGEPDWLNP